jgi:heparin/heparan-sulfate lyase
VDRFTRELVYLPRASVLVVFDRVKSKDPSYRKAWLLHGADEPRVEAPGKGVSVGSGGTSYRNAITATFEAGEGRLRVHTLLPREREVIARGGPGFEFWTPGDAKGGAWGSGQNWPLDPPEGGPLPPDPYLVKMWKTFWGGDLDHLSPSNRRAVVPGGWRIEVSPAAPALEDVFLNVLEIGDRAEGTPRRVAAVEGHGLTGASMENASAVLFANGDGPVTEGEATLPAIATKALLLTGLEPRAPYEVQLTSGFAPGAPVWRQRGEAGDEGTLRFEWDVKQEVRLRLQRLR